MRSNKACNNTECPNKVYGSSVIQFECQDGTRIALECDDVLGFEELAPRGDGVRVVTKSFGEFVTDEPWDEVWYRVTTPDE